MKKTFAIKIIILLLMTIFAFNCEKTDLSKTCQSIDEPCLIQENGVILKGSELQEVGECRLGRTTCDEEANIICEGYVGPREEDCSERDFDCDNNPFNVDKDGDGFFCEEDCDDENPYIPITSNGCDINLNCEGNDIFFLLDASGSMCPEIEVLEKAINSFVSLFQGTDHRFGLVIFPGQNQEALEVKTSPLLTDINSFFSSLENTGCFAEGTEAALDAMKDITNWNNPIGINWRDTATPFIILITDEEARSLNGNTEAIVANNTQNCQVGNCVSGEKFEIYVITQKKFFSQWNDITFHEEKRLRNIAPVQEDRYKDLFYGIFSNLCR